MLLKIIILLLILIIISITAFKFFNSTTANINNAKSNNCEEKNKPDLFAETEDEKQNPIKDEIFANNEETLNKIKENEETLKNLQREFEGYQNQLKTQDDIKERVKEIEEAQKEEVEVDFKNLNIF